MHWLFGSRALHRRGVLGINARNRDYLTPDNPKALYPLADDKHAFRTTCERLGIPMPTTFACYRTPQECERDTLGQACVVKPAHGMGGRGVLVADADTPIREHIRDICTGRFGHPDIALVQQRLLADPTLADLAPGGVPDVRVLLYRSVPALAMLRLPTRASNGRANLHQGGIGVGLDLATGRTTHAILGPQSIVRHPDSAGLLLDRVVPHWEQLLDIAKRVSRVVGLGFVGVDVVPDVTGPIVLEANARPGLEIQRACQQGLRPILERIARLHVE